MTKTKLFIFALFAIVAFAFTSCKEDDKKEYPAELTVSVDNVEYEKEIGKGSVFVTARMPEDCGEYYIAIVPATLGNQIPVDDTENVLALLKRDGRLFDTDIKSEAFDDWSTYILFDDCEYTLLSLPISKDGTAGYAGKFNFTTPRRPLEGNPSITAEAVESNPLYIVTKFTPNADCAQYNITIFEKGTAQQQLEMYGGMMGLYSMKHMIDRFGGERKSGALTDTVPPSKDLIPNTEYELYILTIDKNGVYGDLVIVPMKTGVLGGSGEAKCEIEIGDGSYSADNGVCQMVTVTPNDQSALYRYILIQKDTFDLPKWQEEGVKTYLQTDQPMNPYWDLYVADSWNWPALVPNAQYYVFAMAKNANDVWGPLVRAEFTSISEGGNSEDSMTLTPVPVQSYYNGYYPQYESYNFIPTFVGGDIIPGETGYEGGDGYIFHIDLNSATDTDMKPASGTYTFDSSRKAGTVTPGKALNAGVMKLLEGCVGLHRVGGVITDTIYFSSGTIEVSGDTYTMTLKSEQLDEPFVLKNTKPFAFRDMRQ